MSVIDLEQAQLDDDIEEEIDVVEDGLLSPTEDNALQWQNTRRDQKPQSVIARSVHGAIGPEHPQQRGSMRNQVKKIFSHNAVSEIEEEIPN